MACHYKPYHLHYEKTELNATNSREKSALLIVNVQKAFLPGGSMSVLNNRVDAKNQSLMMINGINQLIESGKFDYHIYVQDAHNHDDNSFASARNAKPFQVVEIEHEGTKYQQILWPDHCRIDGRDYAPRSITGSADHLCKSGSGIQFATELRVPEMFFKNGDAMKTELDSKSFVVNIGEDKNVDSFSAFKNYFKKETGLAASLISKGVKKLYVVGLARDFAAWWTALDGTTYVDSAGNPIFDVSFVWNATLPAPGSDKLLEYEYDGDSNSPHHDRLREAINSDEYGIREVMRGLINHNSKGNRWVQTYLTPYGVKTVNVGELLNIPANSTLGSLAERRVEETNDDNLKRIEQGETRPNVDLDFLNNLRLQDTALSTLRTEEPDI